VGIFDIFSTTDEQKAAEDQIAAFTAGYGRVSESACARAQSPHHHEFRRGPATVYCRTMAPHRASTPMRMPTGGVTAARLAAIPGRMQHPAARQASFPSSRKGDLLVTRGICCARPCLRIAKPRTKARISVSVSVGQFLVSFSDADEARKCLAAQWFLCRRGQFG